VLSLSHASKRGRPTRWFVNEASTANGEAAK
jgi:hypothetical protein